MLIKCLMENTSASEDITAEHGLSLYIETENIKILFDMGQSDAFADNAEKMRIDLSAIDFAVLSHGHYDHGGGLKKFLEINKKAPVYLSKHAFEPHYNGTEKYIGLDTSITGSNRLVFTNETHKINDNISLYSCNNQNLKYSVNPYGLLMKQENTFSDDDFRHEQYLKITENNKSVLISGCSHKGILNIMDFFKPDYLIGGFHFTKLETTGNDAALLSEYSKELRGYNTVFYTCHCTGTTQYEYMKNFMNNKLFYLSAGQTIKI